MSNNSQITANINFTIWAENAEDLADILRSAADRLAGSECLDYQGHWGSHDEGDQGFEYKVEKVEVEEVAD